MFSYFKRQSWGVVRLRGYPYAPYVYALPIHLDTPNMFRVLIGYLFYFIKCFATLEAVMGLSYLAGVNMPLCSYTPIHLDIPICSESFNRVFILLYHKCLPTLEAVMEVVRLRVCPYAPYVYMPPICLDAP